MREINLDDVSGRITAMSYGNLRTGKTRFAATWPRPVFLSDATESGWKTIQTMGSDSWYEPTVRPKVYAIERIVDVINVLNNHVIPGIRNGTFKTIVFDSITFYGDLAYAGILKAQGAKTDTRAAYGDLSNHLRDLRVNVHGLDVNALWLALDRAPEKDSPVGQPLIPGQQSTKFPAGCDFIFYHRAYQEGKNLKFEMRTKKYGAYIAGGRDSGLLPDPIPNPTYRLVLDYLGRKVPLPVVEEEPEVDPAAEAVDEIEPTTIPSFTLTEPTNAVVIPTPAAKAKPTVIRAPAPALRR
jgi:hypothetical protein